jgi:hypothetical protein
MPFAGETTIPCTINTGKGSIHLLVKILERIKFCRVALDIAAGMAQ